MVYEYEGKTEKEAIEKAATELGLERDQFDVEILEAQKNSLFKKGFVKIRVHIEDNVNTSVSKSAIAGTKKIANPEEKKIGIKLESSSSSILIGRKGKNLDALQLLLNVYAGKLGHEEVRVILDTENYRIRREESLVRLAYTTADKVRSSKNSILLEPMNPFERRLIHTTLNDIPDIETKSEGDGLYKQVRVIYKGLV